MLIHGNHVSSRKSQNTSSGKEKSPQGQVKYLKLEIKARLWSRDATWHKDGQFPSPAWEMCRNLLQIEDQLLWAFQWALLPSTTYVKIMLRVVTCSRDIDPWDDESQGVLEVREPILIAKDLLWEVWMNLLLITSRCFIFHPFRRRARTLQPWFPRISHTSETT